MNKIQLVTYKPTNFSNYSPKITVNNFNRLKALDDYDINIFDLGNRDMWQNNSTNESRPSSDTVMTADFNSIKQMISNSTKSVNIVCLPQNLYYSWKCYSDSRTCQLKDMIPTFKTILKQLIPMDDIDLIYENSSTFLDDREIKASFYFHNTGYSILTSSASSNKPTTIKNDRIIITTLDIINDDYDTLILYLTKLELIKEDLDYPDWLYKYSFNDDEIQNNNIALAKEEIKKQKEIIEAANLKIQSNLRFKSILCQNSTSLVEVVFDILEYIFDVQLSDFNDVKQEDFLFKKDGITYIGEIKGVTSNVKYEHISQLEVHYAKYLDHLQENNQDEDIKKVLIINYERNKDISLRDEVNEMQIELAKKNKTLIIDTKSLLTVYERVLIGSFSKESVVDYIKNNSGLIDVDSI